MNHKAILLLILLLSFLASLSNSRSLNKQKIMTQKKDQGGRVIGGEKADQKSGTVRIRIPYICTISGYKITHNLIARKSCENSF